MRIQRYIVASFLALVLGASFGLLKDEVLSNAEANAYEGLRPEHFVDESADRPSAKNVEFENKEILCLEEIIHREARGESMGVRELVAMVTIARRDDSDPQWPKTICGLMRQKNQISGVHKVIAVSSAELRNLAENRAIAIDIYERAWKTQLLPRGWECVRYWKVSDETLARMDTKKFAQLGIRVGFKGLGFFEKLEAVPSPPGKVTFYRDPNRCHKPLPTT